jgi:hypothetical protein
MEKRFPLYIVLTALVCLSLACELINAATEPGPLRVESVDVEPKEGSGKFTASVAMPANNDEDSLSCYIPNATGSGQMTVYQQTVPPSDKSRILTFDFTVTEPGSYKLYCTPGKRMVSGKTTFNVVAPPAEEVPPAQPPSGAQPVKITGAGTRASLSSDEQYSCSAAVDVILVVRADGSAVLSSTGPHFYDHINCTQGAAEDRVSYTIDGTADPTNETVTFTTCNDGGFKAQGKVSYAGGALSGTVACLYNRGDQAGKTDMRLTMP